jgi:hypothetical protein
MKLLIIAVPSSTRDENIELIGTEIAKITNCQQVKINVLNATDFIPEEVKPDNLTAKISSVVDDLLSIGGNHSNTYKFSANFMTAVSNGAINKDLLKFLIDNRKITQDALLKHNAAGVYQLIVTAYTCLAK